MGEHSLSARMQQKIDTVANWAKATNFVPKKGEIIVYSDGGGVGVPKIKVGDGTTIVGSLKFLEAEGLLPTARKISLGTAVNATPTKFDGSKDITIPVKSVIASYLNWGGKNIIGSISPIDAALSYLHNPNRLQFAKPAGITVEYSTDNGATWVDYGASDNNKIDFVSGKIVDFTLGKITSSIPTPVDNQLRITIDASTCRCYFLLRTILIDYSSGGDMNGQVKIEKARQDSPDVFTEIGIYQISGWSGWNSIPISSFLPLGGGSHQSANTRVIRFTFFLTTATPTSPAKVRRIMMFGDNAWEFPSEMARTGHIYDWDSSQNVIFPASITATSFNGKLVNSLTLNGTSYDGSSAVRLSSQQLGVPSAFIAKSVSALDCNNEKIGRVLSSSASNTLTNGPAEIGSTGAGVLWNIPALNSPTSTVNESGTWQYLHQIFITGTSGRVYLRSNSSDETAGNWSYGEWAKVLTDKNFANTVKLSSGGVNLLTNTKSFIGGNYTTKGALQSETYNGFAVRQGVNSSDDAALIIQYSPALEANKSYTLSFWAKGSGSIQALITGYSQPCSSISSENTISTDDGGANTFPLTSSWKRYWITFTMGNWSSAASGKVLWLRARTQDGSGTVANVCGLKWENGSIATDWTPALDDQKIGGTNYLPNLLLKGTQTNITTTYDSSTGVYTLTGNGSTNTSFPQLYSLSLPCKNLAGKTCIFHVDSITASNTALEPRVYITFQDSSGATLVSGLVSLYTSSVTIDVPSTAVSYQYIIRLDQNKAHATTDTATFKGLKLEIGNTPTNWSPAPEDIKHETSSRLVLLSTAWTGSGPYSATLTCSHITASNTVIVSMAAPVSQVQYETFCKAQITANAQADGSISFTAYGTKPTINLPIAITTLGG